MPALALIPVVNAAVVAASPALASHLFNGIIANVGAQVGFQSARLNHNQDIQNKLHEISQMLEAIDWELKTSLGEKSITDVIDEKVLGVVDSTLEINVIPPDETQSHSESWTMK